MKQYLVLILFFGCSKKDIQQTPPAPAAPGQVSVRDYGARGDGVTDDTKAFEKTMRAADSLRQQLFIPTGIYRVKLVLAYDNLQIIGQKQPDDNLQDGSIIVGLIDCNNKKNISISNLGIDARGRLDAADDAALTSGVAIDTVPLHHRFNHITLRGDGYNAFKHGILCQAGPDIEIKNIIVTLFYHGIAVRSSHVLVDSIQANYCGFTSVVVKSAAGLNRYTNHVTVDHVNIQGSKSVVLERGGAVMVYSEEPSSLTSNISIRNVYSVFGGTACVLIEQNKGSVDNVTISNCYAERLADQYDRATYDVNGGSNVFFNNCTSIDSKGFGFRTRNNAVNVQVAGSFEKGSKKGAWVGQYKYLQLNGVEIIK
jgi:hypothetical protein